ncbi:hypothetical protein L210DRAFT_460601 [Boletus edulis BED1]|uniref:Uncharacterized protein n=1 Tax=Boletus edulis BED1 TaxID=1328754 RepID=A0AAD4BIP5_BOLED|nr:hypothetical protein L210DRAFT_460601 [Boletus edulis BED1]
MIISLPSQERYPRGPFLPIFTSCQWLTIFKYRVCLGKELPIIPRYNVPDAFIVQTLDLGFHHVRYRSLHRSLLGYDLRTLLHVLYSWTSRSRFFSHLKLRSRK